MFRRTRWTAVLIVALGVSLGLPGIYGATGLRAEPPEDKPAKKTKKPKDGKKKKSDEGDKKAKKKAVHGFKIGPREISKYEIETGAEGNEVSFTSKTKKETIVGKSTQIAGELEANPHVLHKAKGKFSVAWNTLDTGNPTMNQHMTADPWVDAATNPEIVFTLTGIEKMKHTDKRGTKLKGTLIGSFSINGAAKEMKIPATLEYVTADKSAGRSDDSSSAVLDGEEGSDKEGIRIEAKFGIGLKDFGIVGRGIGVGVAAKPQIKVSLFLPIKAKESHDAPEGGQMRPRGRRPSNR